MWYNQFAANEMDQLFKSALTIIRGYWTKGELE